MSLYCFFILEIIDRYIKPQSLIKLVEEKKSSILILDYRDDKRKLFNYYSNINAITVVQLNSSEITPGFFFNNYIFL